MMDCAADEEARGIGLNPRAFLLGKDARELEQILEKVRICGLNLRLNGLALGLPLATVEFAILDMLGRMAGGGVDWVRAEP
jgi:L-alanine-DL-glutamate epimerase-like enolase superfamily enzyme